MWTGIMIEQYRSSNITGLDPNITRLTNNSVESYFGHLKTHLLDNNKMMCSEYSSIVNNYIEAKHEIYIQNKKFDQVLSTQEAVDGLEMESKWKHKKRKRQRDPTDGPYQNIKNFGDFSWQKTYDTYENPVETDDFSDVFDLKLVYQTN
jgi:hypothetical protein